MQHGYTSFMLENFNLFKAISMSTNIIKKILEYVYPVLKP